MSSAETLLVGSVAYDPKVVTIWEGIRDYFRDAPVKTDYVLFSNYEAQVRALLDGRIDIAWNTNLAYVRTHAATNGACTALAMRDTDIGFMTLLVGRTGELGSLVDLKGKTLALGSRDSVQAAIIPAYALDRVGLTDGEVKLLRFDTDVGKHGDTGTSENRAIKAVLEGQADAAAVGSVSWAMYVDAGQVPPGRLAPFWSSQPYCHCNFTALSTLSSDLASAWTTHLMKMSWEDPEHRRILQMEGLRRWVEPDIDGYRLVFEAADSQGMLRSG